MKEKFDVNNAIEESALFIRDKADATMYKLSKNTADTLAKITIITIVIILLALVFIFANIALGAWVSSFFKIELYYGMLSVAGLYLALLLLFLLISPLIKSFIRNKISKKAINKIVDLNDLIDNTQPQSMGTKVRKELNNDVKTLKPTYKELVRLETDANINATAGANRLKENVSYIKSNYKNILFDLAKSKAIASLYTNKYLAIVLNALNFEKSGCKKKVDIKRSSNDNNKALSRSENNNRKNNHLAKLVLRIASSILWSLFLTKTKRAILAKILPFGLGERKRTKKRGLFF